MKSLEKLIARSAQTAAPPAMITLARAQDTCRQLGSRDSACNNIQSSTSGVCTSCRALFQEKYGYNIPCVTLPEKFIHAMAQHTQ